MPAQSPSFIAGGDIEPSKFVKLTGDHQVEQCVAGDEAIGISHEGTREAPISGITPLAAKDGESCQVYTDGWPCEIKAGTGGVSAGDELKPDANGDAVAAAAGEQYYAVARAAAAEGERIKATVKRGSLPV